MPTLLRCFLLFFFAVGLLTLLAAAWLFVDVQRFARKAVSVTGTVVAVQAEDARSEMEGMPARDITLHRPVVRFQTAQGQMIQFTASFATGAAFQGSYPAPGIALGRTAAVGADGHGVLPDRRMRPSPVRALLADPVRPA